MYPRLHREGHCAHHCDRGRANATANAGGTVTYTVYSNNTCALNPQSAGTKTVANGIVPVSNGIQFNSAGTFYWQVVYSGENNNAPSTSVCTDEVLVVTKSNPSITTTLSAGSASISSTVHDSSALTGATATAGGTVTYTVYTDNQCSLGARDADTKAVTNGVPADSDGLQFNSAGTRSGWSAGAWTGLCHLATWPSGDEAMHRLGVGTMHTMTNYLQSLVLGSLQTREYTFGEKVGLWRGKFSAGVSPLLAEVTTTDLLRRRCLPWTDPSIPYTAPTTSRSTTHWRRPTRSNSARH